MTVRQLRWLLLVAVSSCTGITSGNTPVAIDFVSPVPAVLIKGHTDTLRVCVRDRDGVIVTAPISVMSLDTLYLHVALIGPNDSTVWFGLTVPPDSAARDTTIHSFAAHVVATSGTLQSIPLVITVDSL